MEKLCLFCENCSLKDSRGYGSELTGAYGTRGFECGKGHFDAYSQGSDGELKAVADIRDLSLKAEACVDYQQVTIERAET